MNIPTHESPAAALSRRAEEIAARASRAISDCRENGMHPKATPMNVDAFNELAKLVRDMTQVMKVSQ